MMISSFWRSTTRQEPEPKEEEEEEYEEYEDEEVGGGRKAVVVEHSDNTADDDDDNNNNETIKDNNNNNIGILFPELNHYNHDDGMMKSNTNNYNSNTLQFTSSLCPPGYGLENSAELPFGFIWTPIPTTTAAAAAIESESSSQQQQQGDNNHNNDNIPELIFPINNNNKEQDTSTNTKNTTSTNPLLLPPLKTISNANKKWNKSTTSTSTRRTEDNSHNTKTTAKTRTMATAATELPPIMCVTCLSYLNKYSIFNSDCGEWTCTICGSKNRLPSSTSTIEDGGEQEQQQPSWLSTCLDQPHYMFRQKLYHSFDNNDDDHYDDDDNTNVDINNITSNSTSTNIVIVMDEHLPTDEAHAVGNAIESTFMSLLLASNNSHHHHRYNLGLVIFGKNVSIYQLGGNGHNGHGNHGGSDNNNNDEDSNNYNNNNNNYNNNNNNNSHKMLACADTFATPEGLTDEHLLERQYLTTMDLVVDTNNNNNNNNDNSHTNSHIKVVLGRFWDSIIAEYGPAPVDDDVDDHHGTIEEDQRDHSQQHGQQASIGSSNAYPPSSSSSKTKKLSRMEILRRRKEARIAKEQQQQQQQQPLSSSSSSSNNNNPADPVHHHHNGGARNSGEMTRTTATTIPAKSPFLLSRKMNKKRYSSSSSLVNGDAATTSRGVWSKFGSKQPLLRCTGEAIQIAMELAAAPDVVIANGSNMSHDEENNNSNNNNINNNTSMITPNSGRILCFTNGCPNYGEGTVVSSHLPPSQEDMIQNGGTTTDTAGRITTPGTTSTWGMAADIVDTLELTRSCQYFDHIGRTAYNECGIGIDILCSGSSNLAVNALQACTEPSTGYVVTYDTFLATTTTTCSSNSNNNNNNNRYEGTALQSDLRFLLQDTYISRSTSAASAASDTQQSQEPPMLLWNDGCIVDIRTPLDIVEPTHLVGPGELIDHPKGLLNNEYTAYHAGIEAIEQHQQQQREEEEGRTSRGAARRTRSSSSSSRQAHAAGVDHDIIESTLTRIQFGRCDPLSTISVMLRMINNPDFFHAAAITQKRKQEEASSSSEATVDLEASKMTTTTTNAESSSTTTTTLSFQCIVRYIDYNDCHTLITRVINHQIPIATNVIEFVRSIDDIVTPVLLGKEAVYRSMFGREVDIDTSNNNNDETGGVVTNTLDQEHLERLAYDAQYDLDATIHCISSASRLLDLVEKSTSKGNGKDDEKGRSGLDLVEEGGVRGSASTSTSTSINSIHYTFPKQLISGLRKLYHLRRGPMLCPDPLQSIDDRAILRSLFIRLPIQQCLTMMEPIMYTSGHLIQQQQQQKGTSGTMPTATMRSVSPSTLALWENCILAADHYHAQYVWSGRLTTANTMNDGNNIENSLDYCNSIRHRFNELLRHRRYKRFPTPRLYVVDEIDSMSRRFTSILEPGHGDTIQHQRIHFPELAHLSDEQVQNLLGRFQFYDKRIDPSFNHWFWNVASITSDSKDRGISLCD